MENNANGNYNQDDRNYKDKPRITEFEKSKLNQDPNQFAENDGQLNEERFNSFEQRDSESATSSSNFQESASGNGSRNSDNDQNSNPNFNSDDTIEELGERDDDAFKDINQNEGIFVESVSEKYFLVLQ